MRPRKEEYQLTTGLFLLLGFSRTEEALLKNVTGGSAVDALMYLQMIIRTVSAQMGSECRIKLFQHTSDNLILQVRLFQIASELSNKTYTTYMWQQEREQCEAPARKVAEMIKKRDPKIHDDVHLSLFVLAEVVDNIPNPQKISAAHPSARAVGVGVGVVGIGASTTSWWVWLVGVVLVVVGL
ncbi:uncharacterized protein [Penaeus vannamei]|uniref:uncharacterized protein n=1 Tax=Penaeus vannamei TaxID=6689 RepID=UPI00387F62C1